MLILFYALAALLIMQGLISLAEGFRYRSYVRRSLGDPPSGYQPHVAVIAPYKGIDTGLRENIAALFEQDYRTYEVVFAVESATDPALAELTRALQRLSDGAEATSSQPGGGARPPAHIVVAGPASGSGQKVHNLLAAVAAASDKAEVFAFVDSDARPHAQWLRHLVAPLGQGSSELGATTGYRWYLPERAGLAAVLLSVWNGAIATTLGPHRRNFAWGGSMAITRRAFDELGVRAAWRGAVSDDYALTGAVRRAGKYVKYVPQCLIVSYEDCTLGQLREFTTRQMIITRVYSPNLWRLAWVTHALFNTTFYLGLGLTGWGLLAGEVAWPAALLLLLIYGLGAWKGWLRYRAARLLLGRHAGELRRLCWAYVLLPPFISLLWLYNLVASARTRRITWRGITYELRSPSETVILSQ